MKTQILKAADAVVGPVLVPLVQLIFLPRMDHKTLEKVLFIRPGGIGDAVLLIPAVNALRNRYPHAVIDVLAEKRNAAAFSLCPLFNRIYTYDRPADLLPVLKEVYDVVFDTEQWHRLSAVMARFTRAPMLIGFGSNNRKMLFTHPLVYSQHRHETDVFLDILSPLDEAPPADVITPFLVVPQAAMQKTESLTLSLPKDRILAIFAGGSRQEKRWGIERFRALSHLMSRQGYSLVLLGGKEDFVAAEKIIYGMTLSVNLCGKLSLMETAAVLSRASLLITGDSGLMHIAFGLDRKVLALFGPSNVQKWAPRTAKCTVINKKLRCSPCSTFGFIRKCLRNSECLKAISVEEVFEKAMELLNR